ncbi:hypothetical protein O6H91_07G067900 [Diphasiastrum complanatum]|uniref:Uncharacterized protein n=4 Tax=Diphasiastrum complanatum TaxID=34168 RepID=A0ACC2D6K5_DIPCM|nr:hypothetical protein O6H91_07G010200 [Diphasiastrum complanatum]KAJ7549770.1 hypothetical protein O6H91_07G067900 [Diphasiastrum complanatum]KAJ7549771.1 hypothetical protein O6H91_07G067900 [Diphasiastrum complanatum]
MKMEVQWLLWTIFSILVCRFGFALWSRGRALAPCLSKRSFSTLIVLGSGGHTAEMLDLVSMLNHERYSPRCYVAALTDNMSLSKAQRLEESFIQQAAANHKARYLQIYRSREVGQSYLTSMATTTIGMAHGLWIVFRVRPDIILCNGPGTCLPICIAGFLLKVLSFKWVVMVYIESIARVRKLSLTGLLLYKLCLMDQFFVQWPKLKNKFPRAQYVDRLM